MKIIFKDSKGLVYGDSTSLDCPVPRPGDKMNFPGMRFVALEVSFDFHLPEQRITVLMAPD